MGVVISCYIAPGYPEICKTPGYLKHNGPASIFGGYPRIVPGYAEVLTIPEILKI